jgi:hypothetical protein
MNLPRLRKQLAMCLAGAWLPVTITCRPVDLSGVVRIFGDAYDDAVVVVDGYDGGYYDDCCGYWADDGYDFSFDLFHHHHDDD